MSIEIVTVVAHTIVEVGQLVVIVYGIRSATEFLLAWLESFPRRDPRTPEQIAQDKEVEIG